MVPDLLDDRRSDRLRRARARRRRAEVPQHGDDARLRKRPSSLRAQPRAPRRRERPDAHRRRGLPRLHRAAPGGLRKRRRALSARRSRRSKRPSCASTRSTSIFASTATPPVAGLQPKPSTSRLRVSRTPDPRSASFCFHPETTPIVSFVPTARRSSAACSTLPSPAIAFKIDAEIDQLRAGFDSPARVAPKAEALIRKLAPREEWDRWRVYVAGRLQVSVDDLRNSRFLADSANFAPRARNVLPESRHASVSVEPLSFEREVVGIMLEEPGLAAEYGERISATRFRNEVYRRIYERIVDAAETLRATADVLGSLRRIRRSSTCSPSSDGAIAVRRCGTRTRKSGARTLNG